MMEVDTTHVIVPGSRWHVSITASPSGAPNLKSPSTISRAPHALLSISQRNPAIHSISSIRRKPKFTYRSPDAECPLYITPSTSRPSPPFNTHQTLTSTPGESATTNTTTSDQVTDYSSPSAKRSQSPVFKPAPPVFSMPPPLPIYHPFGLRQRLSLSESSRKTNGDQSKTKQAIQADDEHDTRRSSSRTRKPVAKLLEADDQDGDDNPGSVAGANSGAASGAKANGGSPSKRKRGNLPGNTSRKKRKDASALDRDGTYPNRKVRPSRAAASNANHLVDANGEGDSPPESHLVGSDAGAGGAAEDPAPDAEETTSTKRITRPRRSRVASSNTVTMKRRGSSASEATSTSVSASGTGAAKAAGDPSKS